jgi:hypothetical protein
MANLQLVPHIGLGNTTCSSNAKGIMKANSYKNPLSDDFNSLIEQAVRYQKVSLYTDLNEEMQWALAIAALRENKERAIDAEFENFNVLIADILESKGSQESLSKFYEHLVTVLLKRNKQHDAHLAYCIDNALEKEEDKQKYYATFGDDEEFDFNKEGYLQEVTHAEDHSL